MKIHNVLFIIFLINSVGVVTARFLNCDFIKPELRLGFGPAWISEIGDMRYTYTGTGAEGVTQNKFIPNVGPWLDGNITTQIGDYITFDAYAGGGWIRKGYGMIIQKILISSTSGLPNSSDFHEYDTDITCNFLTTFAGGGFCYNHIDSFFVALTAGYAFNRPLSKL